MEIDHVHFFVEDASIFRDWCVRKLGFQNVAGAANCHTQTEVVCNGPVYFVLSAPLTAASPVAQFLHQHPPGVADLALRVRNLEAAISRAEREGADIQESIQLEQHDHGCLKWSRIRSWQSDCCHTLVERQGTTTLFPAGKHDRQSSFPFLPFAVQSDGSTHQTSRQQSTIQFTAIDHAVMNVATGDLRLTTNWYTRVLGFQAKQSFAIQTSRSGLRSEVMVHPAGSIQLPVNEPASENSQIQEFLHVNRGPGIQHIALQTADILQTITQLRQRGLSLLFVPAQYYAQLRQRSGGQLPLADWRAIADLQILVDWQEKQPQAMLLQTFTQPIFNQPTFFFELIERQTCWVNRQLYRAEGFGEGNFRALFEAIEREQIKRGSL